MLKLIGFALVLGIAALAQTLPTPAANFKSSGWVTGCTASSANSLIRYNDLCVPANLQPIGTFEPPRACQTYPNSNTQTPTRPLANVTANNASTYRYMGYSNQTIYSAKGTYYMLTTTNAGNAIYRASDCVQIRTLSVGTGAALWSSVDDAVVFLVDGQTLSAFNVVTGKTTKSYVFDGRGGRVHLRGATYDGTSENSNDDWIVVNSTVGPSAKWSRWNGSKFTDDPATKGEDESFTPVAGEDYGFNDSASAGTCSGVGSGIAICRWSGSTWSVSPVPVSRWMSMCTVDMKSSAITPHCVDYGTALNYVGYAVDYVMNSPRPSSVTGRRYLIVGASAASHLSSLWWYTAESPTPTLLGQIESPYAGTGNHDGIWKPGEASMASPHSAIGQSTDGRLFYIAGDDLGGSWIEDHPPINLTFLEPGLSAFAAGTPKPIYYSGKHGVVHLTCARGAAYCVISGHAGGTLRGSGDTKTPISVQPGSRMLMLIRGAGEEVTYVGSTMGEYNGDYYGTSPAFGNISQDGTRIAFQTTYGKFNYVNVADFSWKEDSKNIRVTGSSAASPGTLRYVAPSPAACTVTISANANLSMPVYSAASDGGGPVARAFELSSLSASTRYYGRLTCNGVKADFDLLTHRSEQ